MDPDLAMIIGIVMAIFTIPAIMSAFADRRPPRTAAITIIIAGLLIVWAESNKPGGYELLELPDILVEVVARYLT